MKPIPPSLSPAQSVASALSHAYGLPSASTPVRRISNRRPTSRQSSVAKYTSAGGNGSGNPYAVRPACRTLIVASIRPCPYWLAIPVNTIGSALVSEPISPIPVINVTAAVSSNVLFITIFTSTRLHATRLHATVRIRQTRRLMPWRTIPHHTILARHPIQRWLTRVTNSKRNPNSVKGSGFYAANRKMRQIAAFALRQFAPLPK
ncbi:MAG: hypothetical protein BWY63_03672 [Chloroflexi bacterium ADurb.Bin360]|nr:MAG: hypothetical protein BWY63_03672 [Chloroflexi bacterium ADurb.Bin360]